MVGANDEGLMVVDDVMVVIERSFATMRKFKFSGVKQLHWLLEIEISFFLVLRCCSTKQSALAFI